MNLEAPNFIGKDGMIMEEYTADGSGVSPELVWNNVPEGAKSFALYFHDPDAPDPRNPRTDWLHWILVNIPGNVRSIRKGSSAGEEIINDSGRKSYASPSPPIGIHRYIFKLFALNVEKVAGVNKGNFLQKVEPYVIAEAELVGRYGR